MLNIEDAVRGDVLLHDDLEDNGKVSNIYERVVNEIGDVESGFAEADIIVERSF